MLLSILQEKLGEVHRLRFGFKNLYNLGEGWLIGQARVNLQNQIFLREAFMLWAILVGLMIGAFAKLFMPGRDPGGIIITILLGVAGSAVANLVGGRLGYYPADGGAGIVASVIGAMFILLLYRILVSSRV